MSCIILMSSTKKRSLLCLKKLGEKCYYSTPPEKWSPYPKIEFRIPISLSNIRVIRYVNIPDYYDSRDREYLNRLEQVWLKQHHLWEINNQEFERELAKVEERLEREASISEEEETNSKELVADNKRRSQEEMDKFYCQYLEKRREIFQNYQKEWVLDNFKLFGESTRFHRRRVIEWMLGRERIIFLRGLLTRLKSWRLFNHRKSSDIRTSGNRYIQFLQPHTPSNPTSQLDTNSINQLDAFPAVKKANKT